MNYYVPLHINFYLNVLLLSFTLHKIVAHEDGLLCGFHSFLTENHLFLVLAHILGSVLYVLACPDLFIYIIFEVWY